MNTLLSTARRTPGFVRRAPVSRYSVSSISCYSSRIDDDRPKEWRKKQLDRLQDKFDGDRIVDSDEELQPMWRAMEGRVKSRRPRTKQETGGKTGRANVKQTEEDAWLQAGLYDSTEKES